MGELQEGQRIGRYILVRDTDGHLHALTASAILGVSETEDDGVLLCLPGGRLLRCPYPLTRLLWWLSRV